MSLKKTFQHDLHNLLLKDFYLDRQFNAINCIIIVINYFSRYNVADILYCSKWRVTCIITHYGCVPLNARNACEHLLSLFII